MPRMALPTIFSKVVGIQARQTTAFSTTCGFLNDNANQPLIASSGSQCTFDTANTLWGMCRTDVTVPTDCGFGGYCVDTGSCSTGCGATWTDVNTLSWYESRVSQDFATPNEMFSAKRKGASFCVSSILVIATTTAPIPVSTSEVVSSIAKTTSGSSPQSNSEPASHATSASAPDSGSRTSAATKSSNSQSILNSAPSGSSGSQSSDSASLSRLSPKVSIFTISGSIVTSFLGPTNTIGGATISISITSTPTPKSTPSPTSSTAAPPKPESPPKYNFRALIGIALGAHELLLQ
ncbi:hypothetical protein DSL72_009428 [Monilinia vaccinii-corymbosi]|uniref:Uncharacterized protein n=1 Tax=Monilinia vaccinii-corymbosi TaxID=61207 RepID=A0A8A3PQB6_9HELO|nr:hypothetical protein DSL72_009428 [Monilinia vaccinii-corymbosi]